LHSDAINYALRKVGFSHDGTVFLLDSDIFLFKEFSAHEIMDHYDIMAISQTRAHVFYIFPTLTFLNMDKLPNKELINVRPAIIDGHATDTGGSTYFYFKQHAQVKYLDIKHSRYFSREKQYLESIGTNEIGKEFIMSPFGEHYAPEGSEWFYNFTFMHYFSGSNWRNQSLDFHNQKTGFIKKLLDKYGY